MDALGGLSRAVAIAKREIGIPDDEAVALIELSRESPSPLALLSGGGASAPAAALALLQARSCPLQPASQPHIPDLPQPHNIAASMK